MSRVRLATPADVPVLAALRRASTEEDKGRPIVDPDFDRDFAEWFAAERDRTTWLVDDAARAVGYVGLLEYRRMPKPGKPGGLWGYLGNMFVLPEHRNRGLGTALIEAVLARADERGYVRVVLSPSKRAIPLYARAGFVEANGAAADHLLVRPSSAASPSSAGASAGLLNSPRAE